MPTVKSQRVSPALSQLEIRIDNLKDIRSDIQTHEAEISRHEFAIESINFVLAELFETESFYVKRIEELIDAAKEEGFSQEYIDRFLMDRGGRRFKLK